jgi:hypothetical protein
MQATKPRLKLYTGMPYLFFLHQVEAGVILVYWHMESYTTLGVLVEGESLAWM